MNELNPFDGARDQALGRVLREHLDGADAAGFVARMRRAARTRPLDSRDVLARWLYPGMAAAAAIAFAFGIWNRLERPEQATGRIPVQWLADAPPDHNAVLITLVEGR
ncbi:MAG: hypothetical protein ABJD11_16225 [Gemmatimonadota bacterium]